MTERLIQLRENGRRIVRGVIHNRAEARYELDLNENEIKDIEVDLTPILGTETISDAEVTNYGVSCAATLATPKVTLRFSGLSKNCEGRTELKLTRSGGQVQMMYFLARSTESPERSYHYGRVA